MALASFALNLAAAALRLPGWYQALCGAIWAFCAVRMSSTGFPLFDWHGLPVADFFHRSWIGAFSEGDVLMVLRIAVPRP